MEEGKLETVDVNETDTNLGNKNCMGVGSIESASSLSEAYDEYAGFNHPIDVSISQNGTFSLTTNYGDDSIFSLELASHAISCPFEGLMCPVGIDISHDDSFVLVANRRGFFELSANANDHSHYSVAKIDLSQGAVSCIYEGFDCPWGVAISNNSSFALVTNYPNLGTGNLGHIDLRSGEVTFPFSGLDNPAGVAISPDDRFVLVANQGKNNICFIDVETKETSFRYNGIEKPCGLDISSDGSFAIVSSSYGICYLSLQTENWCIIRSDLTGLMGLSISPDGTYALSADSTGNSIHRISLPTTPPASISKTATSGIETTLSKLDLGFYYQ